MQRKSLKTKPEQPDPNMPFEEIVGRLLHVDKKELDEQRRKDECKKQSGKKVDRSK